MSNLQTQSVAEITAGLVTLALVDQIIMNFPCLMDTVPEGEDEPLCPRDSVGVVGVKWGP